MVDFPSFLSVAARRGRNDRANWQVGLVFPKDRIEGLRANWKIALPSRRDFYSFRASQRDMKADLKMGELELRGYLASVRALHSMYQKSVY